MKPPKIDRKLEKEIKDDNKTMRVIFEAPLRPPTLFMTEQQYEDILQWSWLS